MDALHRALDRLRLKKSPPAVVTSEETISPVALNQVGDELKRWAGEARVEPRPVDGVWWRRADAEDKSTKAGFVGLQFHGGGYVLGNAKEVHSGFSRASPVLSLGLGYSSSL